MRASYVTALAFLLLVIGRWAHAKPALNAETVVGGAFVVIVIAAMDAGRTEEIAKGMAWLILAVVALGPDSPLTALSNVANGVKDKATGHAHQVTSAPTQQGGPSA